MAITGGGPAARRRAQRRGIRRNPDLGPDTCLDDGEPRLPDTVLWVRPANGPSVPVHLLSAGCWQRGYDNGRRIVQLSWSLVQATLGPLHTGFGVSGPIPGFPDGEGSEPPKPATT